MKKKQQEALKMEFLKFTKDSTLSEEDSLRLGAEVNRSLSKRHGRKQD